MNKPGKIDLALHDLEEEFENEYVSKEIVAKELAKISGATADLQMKAIPTNKFQLDNIIRRIDALYDKLEKSHNSRNKMGGTARRKKRTRKTKRNRRR